MADLIGKILIGLIRVLVEEWLKQVAIKVCAWLDIRVHGRIARFVLGGLLGLAAFFALPILLGLFP